MRRIFRCILYYRRGLATSMIIWVLAFASSTAIGAEQITDQDITLAVESELLQNTRVPAHLIDVATDRGIVTLSGSVDTIVARDYAMRLTQSVKGVRAVINKIEVRPISRSKACKHMDMTAFLGKCWVDGISKISSLPFFHDRSRNPNLKKIPHIFIEL